MRSSPLLGGRGSRDASTSFARTVASPIRMASSQSRVDGRTPDWSRTTASTVPGSSRRSRKRLRSLKFGYRSRRRILSIARRRLTLGSTRAASSAGSRSASARDPQRREAAKAGSRPRSWPPGDDDLALREEPDRIPTLWMEVPEERVLHPTEREVGHWGRDPDVDPDVPGPDAVPEVPRALPARRVDRRGVPERARVDQVDRLFEVADRREVRDGPEDLLPGDAHVGPDIIENRRTDEVAVITGHPDGPSVQGDLGAFLLPSIDEAHHPIAVGRGNHRTHLDRLVKAVSDLQRGRGIRERASKVIVHVAHADDDGTGEATLSRATVAGGDHVRDDLVEFRVPHDDEDVLRAASGLDALPRGGGFRVDLLRDGARADERDAGDLRVIEDRVDGVLRAVDQVHDARREAGLVDQVHDELHWGRVLLRRLRNPAVPRRDGVRPEPELHHDGEVERADSGEHPEGLVQHFLVDAGAGAVFEVVSHHEARDARGDLHVLDRPPDLATGLVDRLAHVLHDDPREVLEMPSIRSRSVKKYRARSSGGVSRHTSHAPKASWTATSTSSFVQSGTRAITWPVAGFVSSIHSVVCGVRQPPPT